MTSATITIYLEAYGCGQYGNDPHFACLKVDQRFIDRLQQWQQLCLTHSLSELRVEASPDEWYPAGIAEAEQFTYGELVVTASHFWFVDQPKHADYHMETRAQSIEEVIKQVQTGQTPLFLGDDLEYLKEQVLTNCWVVLKSAQSN
ncbi:hypothetical protein HZU77_015610 [Neisseriaceae bacterium TC5R-5]|nr:hypothetical protein [Neisseriaceae bacterium TC5R-5]